jgi:hypothetical protein
MTNDTFSSVDSACEGDFGWVWIENKWRMANILSEETMAVFDESYLTKYYDLNEEALAFPWYPIHQPPCDGTENQPMHVTIRDRSLSVTVSLNLPADDELRDRFFKEVSQAAREFDK